MSVWVPKGLAPYYRYAEYLKDVKETESSGDGVQARTAPSVPEQPPKPLARATENPTLGSDDYVGRMQWSLEDWIYPPVSWLRDHLRRNACGYTCENGCVLHQLSRTARCRAGECELERCKRATGSGDDAGCGCLRCRLGVK